MGYFEVISELEHSEQFRLDRERIIALGVSLGPVAAEEMVVGSMEEIAILLARLRTSIRDRDYTDLVAVASRMKKIAERIGLSKLERVAGDAVYLANTGDGTALAAVLERLYRLADQSLLAVWDATDVSL